MKRTITFKWLIRQILALYGIEEHEVKVQYVVLYLFIRGQKFNYIVRLNYFTCLPGPQF